MVILIFLLLDGMMGISLKRKAYAKKEIAKMAQKYVTESLTFSDS